MGSLKLATVGIFTPQKCVNAFTNWGELVDKHLPAHLVLLLINPWPLIVEESNRYRKRIRPGRY